MRTWQYGVLLLCSVPGKEVGNCSRRREAGEKTSVVSHCFLAEIPLPFLQALGQRVERSVLKMEQDCRPQVGAVQNLPNRHWTYKSLGTVA